LVGINKDMELEQRILNGEKVSYLVKLFNQHFKATYEYSNGKYKVSIYYLTLINKNVKLFDIEKESWNELNDEYLKIEEDYLYIHDGIYKKSEQKYVDLIVNYSKENKEELIKYINDNNFIIFEKIIYGIWTNVSISNFCDDKYMLIIVNKNDNRLCFEYYSFDKIVELINKEYKYSAFMEII
jgi:hypothetical protein